MIVMNILGANEYLAINVIPVFLVLWCVALLTSMIGAIANYIQKHIKIDNIKIIFYCISMGLFLWCCFIELFSRSILLGGFHAS